MLCLKEQPQRLSGLFTVRVRAGAPTMNHGLGLYSTRFVRPVLYRFNDRFGSADATAPIRTHAHHAAPRWQFGSGLQFTAPDIASSTRNGTSNETKKESPTCVVLVGTSSLKKHRLSSPESFRGWFTVRVRAGAPTFIHARWANSSGRRAIFFRWRCV